jgi:hypothetical protein
MALAQHLFALAGIIAIAWASALGLFVLWLFAYSRPAARSVRREVGWLRPGALGRTITN